MEIVKGSEAFLLDTVSRGWKPLPAELSWTSADPIACVVAFGDGREIVWTFAFDLMHAISDNRPAGIGDVRFDVDHLDPNYVLLRLSAPEGKCTLRLNAADVKWFVQTVISLIGAESTSDFVAESLDKALYAILKG